MEFSVLNGISGLVDFSNFGKIVVLILFSDCLFLEFGRFRRFEVCVFEWLGGGWMFGVDIRQVCDLVNLVISGLGLLFGVFWFFDDLGLFCYLVVFAHFAVFGFLV